MEKLQSSYMSKGFLIYEEMRKYFTIYEEAVSHKWLCNWISLYMGKILFPFLSVYSPLFTVHNSTDPIILSRGSDSLALLAAASP